MQRVFVYGSLKRGFHNNRVMVQAGGTYLCDATLNNARMYGLGTYPAVKHSDDTEESVTGEVFNVADDRMDELDWLEGHPQYYKREQRSILGDGGEVYQAWVYLFPHPVRDDATHISSGTWKHSDLTVHRRGAYRGVAELQREAEVERKEG